MLLVIYKNSVVAKKFIINKDELPEFRKKAEEYNIYYVLVETANDE